MKEDLRRSQEKLRPVMPRGKKEVFLALAFCLWNEWIAFPSLLEQEFTADPELATPPKDSITWHFLIHTEELVRN